MAIEKGIMLFFSVITFTLMQNAAGKCLLLEADSNKSSPAGSLHLDVTPREISPGLTESMTLNCSFSSSRDSGVSSIMSLIVSKSVVKENQQESQQDQFLDLVSLNVFSQDQVTELSQVNGSVSGQIDENGDSYISVQWSYPSDDQSGLYKCEVHGMDRAGHPTEMFHTYVVTSQQPSFDQILDKLSELQKQLDRQETLIKNQSKVITMLESNQYNVNTMLQSQLDNHLATILTMEVMLKIVGSFYVSAEYLGHYYLQSKNKNNNSEAQVECRKYGGYLVKITDDTEHQFVKKFLNQYSDVTHVAISGTDEGHEGRWTYSGTDTDLSFTAWHTDQPGTDQSRNCLMMYEGWQWRWYDVSCSSSAYYFMCEIEME